MAAELAPAATVIAAAVAAATAEIVKIAGEDAIGTEEIAMIAEVGAADSAVPAAAADINPI